jgi:DNA-directed RNA polymerase subunit RPC12/RpoP
MNNPKEYYCVDCRCTFFIHSQHQKKHIHCPICSDYIRVERRKARHNRHWTQEENLYIDLVIEKKMSIYEVMEHTKRSYKSIDQRMRRRKHEMSRLSV